MQVKFHFSLYLFITMINSLQCMELQTYALKLLAEQAHLTERLTEPDIAILTEAGNFLCNWQRCPKTCATKEGVMQHITSKHPEIRYKIKRCKKHGCNLIFTNEEMLTKHKKEMHHLNDKLSNEIKI